MHKASLQVNMHFPKQLRASASCSTIGRNSCKPDLHAGMYAHMHILCWYLHAVLKPVFGAQPRYKHMFCAAWRARKHASSVVTTAGSQVELTCRLLLGLVVRLQVVSVGQGLEAVKCKDPRQACCLCCYSRQVGNGLPLSHMHLHTTCF